MSAKSALFLALISGAPVLLVAALALRREPGGGQRRLVLVALATLLAGALSLVSLGIRTFVDTRFGVAVPAAGTVDIVGLVYFFLVVAPMNQAFTAAAIIPALRSRAHQTPYDTMRAATAAAVGFSSVAAGALVLSLPPTWTNFLRLTESSIGHVVFASIWGYALGRTARKRLTGTWFGRAFLLASVFTGIIDHLLFTRGPGALVATTPLVASAALVSLLARRDLRKMSRLPTRRRSRLLRVEPPSLDQIRQALRASKRPVTIRWVVFGTFVTTGVMTSAVGIGVYVGRRTGVDFAAVDRGSTEGALSALVLLGTAVLAAFPISGFLLARASAAKGVLEPALGAAFAIAGIVVLLGLAAPVAVVFALAFAPVAFGLACIGAWIGADR